MPKKTAEALKTYIVGIDSTVREYYRVEATSEEEAEKMLRDFANGVGDFANTSEPVLDGCAEGELKPDSVGDAFEVDEKDER